MTAVNFYLNNENDKDCSKIEIGNPGLGGTEYLIILVATLLSKRDNDISIKLYGNYRGILPKELSFVRCKSFSDFVMKSKADYLVAVSTTVDLRVIESHKKSRFVIWCHNFVSPHILNAYSRLPNIVRVINVGREQMDLYRDHPVFRKSDYIYNTLPANLICQLGKDSLPLRERCNNVVYIGSLIECKGFHILAKSWKSVILHKPDAQLYVIGSGKLYNNDSILGSYGIASPKYEDEFMRYLTDDSGNILPSVHFLGVRGSDKYEILKKCKVGVPNPGGLTETFGLTAVEMQAFGCKVTTIRCAGYLDTVFDQSYLYRKPSQLSDYILKALDDISDNVAAANNIKRKFSYDEIIPLWEKLFISAIKRDEYLHEDRFLIVNQFYRGKQLKEKIRILGEKYTFVTKFPSLESVMQKLHLWKRP